MQGQITVGSGSIAQDTPWLWYRFVANAKAPRWLPSVLLFFALYALGITGAALAGELPTFVRDIRWLAPLGLPSLNSLILSYTPPILDRLWAGLVPWLRNTDDEIDALRHAAPRLLTRFFWPIAIVLTGLVGQYTIVSAPGNWTQEYKNPQFLSAVTLIATPFVGYFVGGAASIAIGLGTLVYRMSRSLRFRRGFTIEGGKRALQPFNQLVWLIWGVMTPTLLFVVVASAALSRAALGNVILTATEAILTVGSVIVPQLFMNRLLRGAKAAELVVLQDELTQVAALPAQASANEGIQRLLRHEHLLYQFHRAENFTPTLIDYRFALQILVSVATAILANVLMRTVVARVLP